MSYIDCYDHSDVGTFLSRRVYHPLQQLDKEGFEINETNFLIGGGGIEGGGEQKSYIFPSLDACVYLYIEFCADIARETARAYDLDQVAIFEYQEKLLKEFRQATDEEIYVPYIIWHNLSIDEATELAAEANKARPNTINEEKWAKLSTEHKLAILFGNVVYWIGRKYLKPELKKIIEERNQFIQLLPEPSNIQKIHQQTYPYQVMYQQRLADEAFRPAQVNWDCGGRKKINGEIVYGNICYFNEE